MVLGYIVVVPVFMVAVLAIAQGAMWYLAREAALAAARQGADAARLPGGSAGDGRSAALAFARNAASGYLLQPDANTGGSSAATVQITVSGTVPTLVPMWQLNVSQTVQAPVERFAAPTAPGVVPGGTRTP